MRHGLVVGVVIALETALLAAAAPPKRRPLDTKEREAILTLLKAVDLAQETDVLSDAGLAWSNHVLQKAQIGCRLGHRSIPQDREMRRGEHTQV